MKGYNESTVQYRKQYDKLENKSTEEYKDTEKNKVEMQTQAKKVHRKESTWYERRYERRVKSVTQYERQKYAGNQRRKEKSEERQQVEREFKSIVEVTDEEFQEYCRSD